MKDFAILVLPTFLIILCFFVRFLNIALDYYKGGRVAWAITYGVVDLLLLFCVLITAGFHL